MGTGWRANPLGQALRRLCPGDVADRQRMVANHHIAFEPDVSLAGAGLLVGQSVEWQVTIEFVAAAVEVLNLAVWP